MPRMPMNLFVLHHTSLADHQVAAALVENQAVAVPAEVDQVAEVVVAAEDQVVGQVVAVVEDQVVAVVEDQVAAAVEDQVAAVAAVAAVAVEVEAAEEVQEVQALVEAQLAHQRVATRCYCWVLLQWLEVLSLLLHTEEKNGWSPHLILSLDRLTDVFLSSVPLREKENVDPDHHVVSTPKICTNPHRPLYRNLYKADTG